MPEGARSLLDHESHESVLRALHIRVIRVIRGSKILDTAERFGMLSLVKTIRNVRVVTRTKSQKNAMNRRSPWRDCKWLPHWAIPVMATVELNRIAAGASCGSVVGLLANHFSLRVDCGTCV